jgi:hypothetical protein
MDHPDVRYVRTPNLIRPANFEPFQQIGVDFNKDKGTLMKISTLQDEGIVIKRSYATTSKTGCGGSSSSHHGPWD